MKVLNFGLFDIWYEAVETALKGRYFSLSLIVDRDITLSLYIDGIKSIFHIEIDQGSALPTELERGINCGVELNTMEMKAEEEVENYGK